MLEDIHMKAASHCDDADWKHYMARIRAELAKYSLYHSFTTNKTYKLFTADIERNKKLQTASGLLQDIAAFTNSLDAHQAAYKKEVTNEAFAAYVGLYCAIKMSGVEKKFEVSRDEAEENYADVWQDVYKYIVSQVKKYFATGEEGKTLKGLRAHIQYKADMASIDRYNKWHPKKSESGCGKEDTERFQFIPLETINKNSGKEITSPDFEEYLCDRIGAWIKLDQTKNACFRALEICYAKKEITEGEYNIVSMHFGFCEGLNDQLSLTEISKEIGKSYSYVVKHYNKAIEQIRQRIKIL